MPKRYVFGKSEAVKFPEDEKTKTLRIQFVQNTRKDSTIPSSFSCICSLHFSSSCLKQTWLAIPLAFVQGNVSFLTSKSLVKVKNSYFRPRQTKIMI